MFTEIKMGTKNRMLYKFADIYFSVSLARNNKYQKYQTKLPPFSARLVDLRLLHRPNESYRVM